MEESSKEVDTSEEEFTILTDNDVREAEEESFKVQDESLEKVINDISDIDLRADDIKEVVSELRHLEEKLHLWREVRMTTIGELRDIADYVERVGRQTGIAKVVGSSGGVLAGGLTIAGGVMTVVMTGGAALPVLAAGAGLGLASGLTGASAALSKKILSSKQMSRVHTAIEVDSQATQELVTQVETVKADTRVTRVAGVMLTVGGLASSTKGLMDVLRGASPGQTIIAGLEAVGQIFGENVNKEIVKLLARTSGQVLSGTVTGVFGGVTMLWDMYQLKTGLQYIVEGGEEVADQIRDIAAQLEQGLMEFSNDHTSHDQSEHNDHSSDDQSEHNDHPSNNQSEHNDRPSNNQSEQIVENYITQGCDSKRY